MRKLRGIYVDDSIYEYVAKIAAKTRSRENIIQGVSPRGSIAVIAMAKAEAFFAAVIIMFFHQILRILLLKHLHTE